MAVFSRWFPSRKLSTLTSRNSTSWTFSFTWPCRRNVAKGRRTLSNPIERTSTVSSSCPTGTFSVYSPPSLQDTPIEVPSSCNVAYGTPCPPEVTRPLMATTSPCAHSSIGKSIIMNTIRCISAFRLSCKYTHFF